MWVVIKKKFRRTGPVVYGGSIPEYYEMSIDRTVETLDEVKKGEIFFKCNVKN